MFKRILVAIDDSGCAQSALALAIELATVHQAKLIIVRVVDPIEASAPAMDPYGSIQPFMEGLVENAHELIDQATVRATAAGILADGRVLTGAPIPTLVELADREKVDLIALGSHGRKGLSRLLVGSVAEGVMRESSCPTLIIHARHTAGV